MRRLAAANDCNAGPDELEDEGTRRIGQPSTVRTLKGLVALGLSPGQLLLSRSSGDGVFTPRVSTGTSTRTKPAPSQPTDRPRGDGQGKHLSRAILRAHAPAGCDQ